MQKLSIIFLLSAIASACQHNLKKVESKTLDLGAFSLETPVSWQHVPMKSIDSYAGQIAIDSNDTLEFDLGWYSDDLYEHDPVILDSSMMAHIDTAVLDTSEVIFRQDRTFVDPDIYRKNNVSWDTIDSRRAKLIYPRVTGVGITGVFIDSVWGNRPTLTRFNLYGENLSSSNEQQVLRVIRTLKFHQEKK